MTSDRKNEHRLDGEVWFDRPKLRRLRKAIEQCETTGAESFIFDGREYFLPYARYLAEYLDGVLPPSAN